MVYYFKVVWYRIDKDDIFSKESLVLKNFRWNFINCCDEFVIFDCESTCLTMYHKLPSDLLTLFN